MNATNRPVFDASAVLAIIQGETGDERLRKLLDDAVVSSVTVAEVLAKLVSKGARREDATAVFDALHLKVLDFDAIDARLSAEFVGKDIALGDRCFLACASRNGTGWTADHPLAKKPSKNLPPLKLFR